MLLSSIVNVYGEHSSFNISWSVPEHLGLQKLFQFGGYGRVHTDDFPVLWGQGEISVM